MEPRKSDSRSVAMVAAGGVILGSLLPWASISTGFGTISMSGTDGDGVITLLLGSMAVALLAQNTPTPGSIGSEMLKKL